MPPVPDDAIVKAEMAEKKRAPRVGELWQNELAELLLQFCPEALDNGAGMSDISRYTLNR